MSKNSVIIKKRKETGRSPLIIVSSKISRKAVLRNKVKRRIKEIIRKYPKETLRNYKIIACPGILNIPYKQLEEEIEKAIGN